MRIVEPAVCLSLGALVALLAGKIMPLMTRALRLERKNFRGETIPAGAGLVLVPAAIVAYLYEAHLGSWPQSWVLLAGIVGFGIVGLVDDLYGNRRAGGFRGHLGLLRQGKVSTGLAKMVIGGLLSLALGGVIARYGLVMTVLNGLVISLTANLINLLDLRPGRAVSCFWVGLLAVLVSSLGHNVGWRFVLVIAAPVAWLTWEDRRARLMLGDAGSNALGACLGVLVACEVGAIAKLVVVALLVGVHVYSEKHSISRLIEENRALRGVDRLLGER